MTTKSKSFDFHRSSNWTINRVVIAQANRIPEKTAIEFIGGSSFSFKECKDVALEAAGDLQQAGVTSGTNVALMIDSPERYFRYWLGLNFLGSTMVAINTSMRGNLLRHQLEISESSVVIADPQYMDECARIEHSFTLLSASKLINSSNKPITNAEVYESKSSDLSCVMFTSGTSGPSKGVLMPQAHCMLFAVGTIDNYDLKEDDVFYICLPLFHANGLFMQLLACLVVGCKAVIREKFSASSWLSEIRHYNITHTNTLGAVAAFIVAQNPTPHDTDHSLRVIGAAPLSVVAEAVFRQRFGVQSVVPLYGMTEVNIPLYGKLNESAPGTCGYVYDKYFEVEIRHPETDEPMADGEHGELMVRPKLANGFMSGYVGMPEQTLEAWRNFWFHTGDAAYRNENGQFVFVDRIKDCIRKRGENISSYEVEQAFLAIEGIAEIAAYAVPADGGEGMEDEVMITLMVKEDAEIDINSWIKSASQNLQVFAVPRYVRVVDTLPKTPTGKIRKIVLREEGITTDTHDRKL